MIPATNVRTVHTNGVKAGAEFGISLADSAHIMTILRDTLYSDKILAVIREYSANAWDSHRTSGKGTLPIKVRLPTADEPVFSVQDFGKGLSRQQVFEVYTQYGASTKREDDTAVGMLGIGSKSGFAYSDTFTITSRHGGTKSVYSAMLDPSDKGIISLISEEECGDETGITIEIPAKSSDFEFFRERAGKLFVHFDPRPDINMRLQERPPLLGKFPSGVLFNTTSYEDNRLVAVMGCIPYRINLNQVTTFEEGLPQFMVNLSAELHFEIGEVHINASREELKYSDKTKRAIIDRYTKLIEEYILGAVKAIRDPAALPWNKRLAAQSLRNFGTFVPKDVKMYTDYSVQVGDKIPTVEVLNAEGKMEKKCIFYVSSGRHEQSNIAVNEEVRLLIKDDNRTLKGFHLGTHDYLIYRGPDKQEFDVLRDQLDAVLKDTELTGIPIMKLSDMNWVSPNAGIVRPVNVKHGKKVFKFSPGGSSYYSRHSAPSQYWEVETLVPSDDDVYVELESFRSTGVDILGVWAEDSKLAEKFGIKMPTVYGYKVTVKEPSKKRQGTEYGEWRIKMAKQVTETQEYKDMIEYHGWESLFSSYHYGRADHSNALAHALGRNHMITKFFVDRNKAIKFGTGRESEISDTIRKVERMISAGMPSNKVAGTGQRRLDEIVKAYPLFSAQGVNLESIGIQSDLPKWTTYIELLDNQGAKP